MPAAPAGQTVRSTKLPVPCIAWRRSVTDRQTPDHFGADRSLGGRQPIGHGRAVGSRVRRRYGDLRRAHLDPAAGPRPDMAGARLAGRLVHPEPEGDVIVGVLLDGDQLGPVGGVAVLLVEAHR